MPRYRVIVHGWNFRLNLEGKWERMGFYTPLFADAADPLLAEHTALEDFRQTTKYRDLMEATLNAADDAPVLASLLHVGRHGRGVGEPGRSMTAR